MKNWMGIELNGAEKDLVGIYNNLLKILKERNEELKPYEVCNAKKALGALWQIVNGLDLDPGQLYDVGV